MKKIICVLLAVLALVAFSACGKSVVWPEGGLADMVAVPKASQLTVLTNTDTVLLIDAYGITKEEFSEYIDLCREDGFVVDAKEESNSYAAYHRNNSKLTLAYLPSDTRMTIEIVTRDADSTWDDLAKLKDDADALENKLNDLYRNVGEMIGFRFAPTEFSEAPDYFAVLAYLAEESVGMSEVRNELNACLTQAGLLGGRVESNVQREQLTAIEEQLDEAKDTFAIINDMIRTIKMLSQTYFNEANAAMDTFAIVSDQIIEEMEKIEIDQEALMDEFYSWMGEVGYPTIPEDEMQPVLETALRMKGRVDVLMYRLDVCKEMLDSIAFYEGERGEEVRGINVTITVRRNYLNNMISDLDGMEAMLIDRINKPVAKEKDPQTDKTTGNTQTTEDSEYGEDWEYTDDTEY